jgi:molybdopterin synthase catalytic subunit
LIAFDVLLFAAARDAAGQERLAVELPEGSRVADLALALPQLAAILPRCRIAVNHEFADAERALNPGDEIAVIPPVSGG